MKNKICFLSQPTTKVPDMILDKDYKPNMKLRILTCSFPIRRIMIQKDNQRKTNKV